MAAPADWIEPDWPAPERVKALVTTRSGGVSRGPYASLNLGTRVGDDARAVAENRARLNARLPSEPRWLQQVHGIDVVQADCAAAESVADGAFTRARQESSAPSRSRTACPSSSATATGLAWQPRTQAGAG